jgi:hypothetical protein
MFVFKKRIKLIHQGLGYTAKNMLLSNTSYSVYGSMDILWFVKKHNISTFYISYIPKKIEDNPSFQSILYLRCGLDWDKELFSDLFKVLSLIGTSEHSSKRMEENKGKYISKLNEKREKERMREREEEIFRRKQMSGEPQKDSRRKKPRSVRKVTFKR